MKRTQRAAAVVVVLLMVLGLLATGTAFAGDPAGIWPGEGSKLPIGAEVPKLAAKFAPIDGESIIVFADAKTNDLWVTDAMGSGPIRVAKTPKIIESDPAGWFPWVVYSARPVGSSNSDIFMMSLLGDLEGFGKGRVQITDNLHADVEPSIIAMPYFFIPPGAPAEAAPDPKTLIFGDPIIMWASDRVADRGNCGWEIYNEYLNLTGPIRASKCDGVDKREPQWDNPFTDSMYLLFAYAGHRPSGSDIWVSESYLLMSGGIADPERITDSGIASHPSWAPMINTAPETALQPAGSFPISYEAATPKATLRITPPDSVLLKDPNRSLLNPEWYNFDEPCLLFERAASATNVTVAYTCDGLDIDVVTKPGDFIPTDADFLGMPPLPV